MGKFVVGRQWGPDEEALEESIHFRESYVCKVKSVTFFT